MDVRNQTVRGEEGENSGALRENKARGLGRFSLLLLKYRAVVASIGSRSSLLPHLVHAPPGLSRSHHARVMLEHDGCKTDMEPERSISAHVSGLLLAAC